MQASPNSLAWLFFVVIDLEETLSSQLGILRVMKGGRVKRVRSRISPLFAPSPPPLILSPLVDALSPSDFTWPR